MGSVFLYLVTIGFALGILTRSFFDIGLPVITWMMLLAVVAALVGSKKSKALFAPSVTAVGIFIFCLALGMLRMEWASWSETNPYFETVINTEATFEGIIAREPDIRETSTHLYVDIEGELALVTVDRHTDFQYGDMVRMTGVVEKPEAFETDLGRIFNYPRYLQTRGVSYKVSFAEVSVLDTQQGNPIFTAIFDFKHRFMRSVESLIPEPQSGLSEGLLLGVKRALGSDLEEVFRKTGIIHIVVLSGYNVMLVVLFVMYILGFLLGKRFSAIFGIVAIAGFAILVGLSATVVRASIMAGLLLIVGITGRVYFVTRGLMLAGIIMLLFNPYLLAFDPGFQLSFLATLGLILVAPHIEKRLQFMTTTFSVREFLTATLATQLFVMPLLLYQIGEFSVVSVIVNVLVLPMVPVAMLLTFITGLIGMVSGFIALPFAYVTYLSLSYIILIAEFFATAPFASFIVPSFSFWIVPFSYGVIGYALFRISQKQTLETTPTQKPETNLLQGWTIVEEKE